MVRVIYRWQVSDDNFTAFQAAWSSATNHIHQTVPGALGSFMLRDAQNPNEILTIAKWDKMASWKSFWGTEKPKEMELMRELGQAIETNAYEEIEDFTR